MSAQLEWRHAAGSNVGRVRQRNEDSFGADTPSGLFVVADGMGGHAAGEVASALAVRCAAEGLAMLSEDAAKDEATKVLKDAIADANQVILIEGEAHPEKSGMGTTATALLLSRHGWWLVGHVGDSRAYLVREGEVDRITEDHTYVQELVNQGRISAEEARLHPRSSLLTRALGTTEGVRIDIYEGSLESGDRFVLASDGLMTMLPEERIQELLLQPWDADKLVNRLIETANEAGGHDNTTAVVVDVMAARPEEG
ncbi:MAG: Stp1/IreP family PP2C-type Ser/Thr phosphatase [Gemmatimonadota bacterium]|nr:Stp1/IreP family PP2C-type Ser/Thr phosphatase [Gemmatimonadota bacterium]